MNKCEMTGKHYENDTGGCSNESVGFISHKMASPGVDEWRICEYHIQDFFHSGKYPNTQKNWELFLDKNGCKRWTT